MKDLSGSTAFVTGAGKGIGRGIARALASRGVRLGLVDLDHKALAQISTELGETTAVRTFAFDVRDRDAFAGAVDEAESQLGPITVLCNNAGLVFAEDLPSMTFEVWDLVLGVNLGGVVNGIQTVLPRMIDRGGPGHIVNTASVAGLGPGGGLMYTTSKYAVVGLSEGLRDLLRARELPIGVTALCPGAVATEIAATGHAAMADLSQSGAARDFVDRLAGPTAELLAKHGVDPDSVGRAVVDAIITDQAFVLTDRAAENKIRKRTRDILESMPLEASVESDETIYESASSLRES